jgi:hypothetical protein
MSAILVLKQRNAVHLMSDACTYEIETGVLVDNNLAKCIALPTLSAAISSTGPAEMGAFMGGSIAQEFLSFDDLIDRAEQCLPKIFEDFADTMRAGDAFASLYLIGWHKAQARPAAYCMECSTNESSRMAKIIENDPSAANAKFFKLAEQNFSGTPLPGADLIAAAGFNIPADFNALDPELDLLHVLEIMRHEEIEGHYWIGGKALLTSIDAHGITQRIVHHWPEDKIGEPILPLPIDFKSWRAARVGAKVAAIVPDGLSRLQRDRMEKKIRKGTLRSA